MLYTVPGTFSTHHIFICFGDLADELRKIVKSVMIGGVPDKILN
jgi:hypothetical protein